jgi:hypothetical protein
VKEAGIGNLGLHDRKYHTFLGLLSPIYSVLTSHLFVTEREALRWVQKYVGAFGGDPEKVTMCACIINIHMCIPPLTWMKLAGENQRVPFRLLFI